MLEFLKDTDAHYLASAVEGVPADRQRLFLGDSEGGDCLEVLVLQPDTALNVATLRKAWRERRAGRAVPLLVVAPGKSGLISICGPTGENPPVHMRPAEDANRLIIAALEEPGAEQAARYLRSALDDTQAELPGLRNEGLFSLHTLKTFGRTETGEAHAEFSLAVEEARTVRRERGRPLLKALGYTPEDRRNDTLVLRAKDKGQALAVLLRRDEHPETMQARFNDLSPVSYALNQADRDNLDWVILAKGPVLRLYPTKLDVGVGRRGRTETFVEIDLRRVSDSNAAFLPLIFGADALDVDGSVADMLRKSERYAASLAERLRERIYDEVVPRLARAVVEARGACKTSAEDLDLTYEITLTILFRLLFIAYAEDGDLLPYDTNDEYRDRSLKRKAHALLKVRQGGTQLASGSSHWDEVLKLFEAVDKGNREWGVPAYNGGLFSDKRAVSPAGAEISALDLSNADFAIALSHLLLSFDDKTLGPVDFRSLGVREFGTIYEGLLESELSVADQDLSIKYKTKKSWKPGKRASSKADDLVYVPFEARADIELAPDIVKGQVYLHNKSGARKSSGAYYTKPFAVEHLLDRALEPALEAHLTRVDELEESDAAKALFDFRVADIAMGSAHFLVAAVDRIERRFADYLVRRSENERPMAHALKELDDLKQAARRAMNDPNVEIEDTQLLRRLIARRCLYGTDINPLAVQLARLAVWIHTFVPGLPLAMLDHNFQLGNALVGVGSVQQLKDRLDEASSDLFGQDVNQLFEDALPHLERLRTLADTNAAEVAASRDAMAKAELALADVRELCDVITAEHLSDDVLFDPQNWEPGEISLDRQATVRAARDALNGLQPMHFPVAFPEVFIRKRSGFDVILGNPPWKEATAEKLAYWARYFPGLRGMKSAQQNARMKALPKERPDLVEGLEKEVAEADRLRAALMKGGFEGMGKGDPDVYKAFCWRFWDVTAQDSGHFGVVLPRSAFIASGSESFRRTLFSEADKIDMTLLLNNRNWVFGEVHPQYTFVLLAIEKGASDQTQIAFSKVIASKSEYALAHPSSGEAQRHMASGTDVLGWTPVAAVPLAPTPKSFDIIERMSEAPKVGERYQGQWRARPDTELHATNDAKYFDRGATKPGPGQWPVYKGASFDLWEPDTGEVYGYADPDVVLERLQKKRSRARHDSVHREFDNNYRLNPKTLAPNTARLVFRDVTRSTDQRTMRAALIPPMTFITNKGPYVLFSEGDETDEAYLLGLLSSIPTDWISRRYVEISFNFFLFNLLPIPRPNCTNPLRKRVVELSGRLAAVDARYAKWAEAVGVEFGPLDSIDKQDKIHELDALSAHLYALSRDQLTHIFETFHEGWDYQPRLDAVLKHYDAWASSVPDDYRPDEAVRDALAAQKGAAK